MYVSSFTPNPAHGAELLACLWQGPVPPSLQLTTWLYMPGEPRRILFIWDGDDDAVAFVEGVLSPFGELTTDLATDATGLLASALARDLDACRTWLSNSGTPPDAVEQQVEIRRLGLESASRDEAIAAAQAWAARLAQERG